MTIPESLIYQAICDGAFNPLQQAPQPGNRQQVTQAILSQVLGDESTQPMDAALLAATMTVYVQNKTNALNAAVTKQQASVASLQSALTTLTTAAMTAALVPAAS